MLAVLAVLAAALLLLGRRGFGPAAPRSRLNLLLVTLDTTRADRIGCYGYAAARTPHLDRLAAEGIRFERAYAPAPITLPAHASIFTGLYPFEHGVRNNGNFYLTDRFETLATVLKGQGYRTAAFVSTFILDRRYGLARGFETYDDRMEGAQPQVLALEAERRGDRTALGLSRWLQASVGAPTPFFAWLHLYDPHEPYRPPPPFREVFASRPYDGEIAFDDAAVASILDKLSATGLLDRTLVAVVADHGESLGDHGEETHSMFVYDSAIRIPMILWRPGRLASGVVVREPVRAIDLAPTLLDLLGAPALKAPHARSLVPLIEGRSGGRPPPAYAETYLPKFYMNWAPLRTIVDERYKLIEAPRPELYDLARDPGEKDSRLEAQPQTAAALRAELDRLTAGSEGELSVGAVDREAVEKLAALGYIGAGAEPAAPATGSPRDPKDVITVFNRLRRANSAVRDRRFGEALPVLHEVLAEDPRNAFARLVLGSEDPFEFVHAPPLLKALIGTRAATFGTSANPTTRSCLRDASRHPLAVVRPGQGTRLAACILFPCAGAGRRTTVHAKPGDRRAAPWETTFTRPTSLERSSDERARAQAPHPPRGEGAPARRPDRPRREGPCRGGRACEARLRGRVGDHGA